MTFRSLHKIRKNQVRGETKKVIAAASVLRSDRADIVVPTESLALEDQHRLAVIQRLQSYQGRAAYRVEQALST